MTREAKWTDPVTDANVATDLGLNEGQSVEDYARRTLSAEANPVDVADEIAIATNWDPSEVQRAVNAIAAELANPAPPTSAGDKKGGTPGTRRGMTPPIAWSSPVTNFTSKEQIKAAGLPIPDPEKISLEDISLIGFAWWVGKVVQPRVKGYLVKLQQATGDKIDAGAIQNRVSQVATHKITIELPEALQSATPIYPAASEGTASGAPPPIASTLLDPGHFQDGRGRVRSDVLASEAFDADKLDKAGLPPTQNMNLGEYCRAASESGVLGYAQAVIGCCVVDFGLLPKLVMGKAALQRKLKSGGSKPSKPGTALGGRPRDDIKQVPADWDGPASGTFKVTKLESYGLSLPEEDEPLRDYIEVLVAGGNEYLAKDLSLCIMTGVILTEEEISAFIASLAPSPTSADDWVTKKAKDVFAISELSVQCLMLPGGGMLAGEYTEFIIGTGAKASQLATAAVLDVKLTAEMVEAYVAEVHSGARPSAIKPPPPPPPTYGELHLDATGVLIEALRRQAIQPQVAQELANTLEALGVESRVLLSYIPDLTQPQLPRPSYASVARLMRERQETERRREIVALARDVELPSFHGEPVPEPAPNPKGTTEFQQSPVEGTS